MFSAPKIAPVCLSLLGCLQLMMPAVAQTTVLTGQVSQSDRPLLLRQSPNYAPVAKPVVLRSNARTTVVNRPVVKTVYVKDNRTFFQRHPRVKAAAIGAGVGTAAGAVTGLVTRKGVFRGAAIGAGTGAGVGLVRSSPLMKRHPIVNDVATGSLVGLGLGAASGHGGSRALKGTGVGAAVGLGVGLLRNGLK